MRTIVFRLTCLIFAFLTSFWSLNLCADLEGVSGGSRPPPPLENENLLNLRNKIIANMPKTPLGKHNYPSNPSPLWKIFLDPRMKSLGMKRI